MRSPAPTFTARSRPHFCALLSAVLATVLLSSSARAESCDPDLGLSTCIDADNLWIHPGGGSFFSVAPTLTTPSSKSAFGLSVGYLSRPIGLRVASADPEGTPIFAIDNQVNATFHWEVGITDRLALSLVLPVTVFQDGAGIAAVRGSDETLPRSVIRDGRFGLSFAILPRARKGEDRGLGLTAHMQFGAPFGAKEWFGGAGTLVATPTLSADYRIGALLIGTELGARIRDKRNLANAVIGTQLYGALGISYDILKGRMLSAGAEAFALYTLSEQKAATAQAGADAETQALVPAEWLATVSSAPFLGGDLVFMASGGGFIPTGSESAVTTPRFRFNLGVRYAPTNRDTDADNVLDRDDKCPLKAEDRDGFQDEDGCPEPDNDQDRIPDDRDRCRDEAETVDGFEDQDGCPDLDDDKDKVPDDTDKCRNAAEDLDNFEDEDGCPDPDNDNDGILDTADRCPNGPEDKDGFKDTDGCPDPDNDLDQVNDELDKCSRLAEDRDGFKDDDGCPDPDNDEDGVLDSADKCSTQAETINGDADEDGCPEPKAQSLVQWQGDRVVIEKLVRFTAGRADISKELNAQLKMAAQLIRGHAPLELIIIEAYGDRSGDSSDAATQLADKRATAVKQALVAAGLPADRITATTGDLLAKRNAGAPQIEITVTRTKIEDKR